MANKPVMVYGPNTALAIQDTVGDGSAFALDVMYTPHDASVGVADMLELNRVVLEGGDHSKVQISS